MSKSPKKELLLEARHNCTQCWTYTEFRYCYDDRCKDYTSVGRAEYSSADVNHNTT